MISSLLARLPKQLRRNMLAPAAAAAAAALALMAGCGAESPQSLIASGKQRSASGDHKAAVIQYKAALQQDPQSVEARALLGQEMLDAGDPAGAVVELTRALEANAPAASVLPALSRALVVAGEYKKLATRYGELDIEDKRPLAALKVNVAIAWGALGDRAKTEAAIAAALTAVPDYPPARILEARMLAGNGKFEQAQALVEKTLAADDKLADAWQLRGELLSVGGGDGKSAEDSFRKVLAIDRSHVAAHSAIISASILRRDFAGAKAQADQLRQALPNHPMSQLVDGQLAFLDGELPRAREIAQRLLRYLPDNLAVLVLAGTVEAEMGAVGQAQAHFGKALQLNPSLDVARSSLAEAEVRLGQYAKAMETLKPMLQANPPRVEALALAGDTELRQSNLEAAEKYFLRAAELDPSNERLRTAAAVTRIARGDAMTGFNDLEVLTSKTKGTYVDQAIFAARMRRSEFPAALAALDRMAAKEPNKAALLELRGRLQLARNDLPAARAAFEQAAKVDPKLFAAVSSLASIDLLENQPAKAAARMQQAVSENPRNTAALMALAELKARSDAPIDEVKKLLADAVASAPSSAAPRLQLIELLLRKRQFKDALAAASETAAALPGDALVLETVGRAQVQGGDIEQAATTFRKLAAVVPKSALPYLRLASVYSASGQRQQAESALNQALELEPNNATAQAALLDLLVNSNRKTGALDYIRRLKQSKPNQPVPYLLEATFHMRQKNVDAAAASFREGIAKTNSPELAVGLYTLLLQNGGKVEADQFGAVWMQKHPQDMAMEYQLAMTNIARNELAPAEDRLKRVLEVLPNQPLALNNLAWVIASRGKAGAVVYAQRAVNLMPDNPNVMDTLAMALAAEKRLPAALEVQKRAVILAPNDGNLRLSLAKLALQSGNKPLAEKELKRLQELGPAFAGQPEVSRLIQGL